MDRHDSAFAVICRGDRVLLVKSHTKKHWQLPGGALKSGESPWEGARREVLEETGLRAAPVRLTGTYLRDDGSLVYVFAARTPRGAEPTGPRNEIEKQRWLIAPEAIGRLSESARSRLLDALRQPAPRLGRARPRLLPVTVGG